MREKCIEKKREYWVDSFRALAIVFVFFSHCMPEGHRNLFPTYFGFCFMPIFFFLSGYLHKEGRNFKQLFNRVFFRLYVPFVFFCLVRAIMHVITGGTFEEYGKELLKSMLFGMSNIWFFPCIITVEVLAWCIDRVLGMSANKVIGGGKFLIVIISFISLYFINNQGRCFWHANTAITMLSFFYIGNLFKEYNTIERFKRIKYVIIVLMFFVYLVCCNVAVVEYGLSCNVSINQYKSVLVFIILSVSGILSYLLLIKPLPQYKIVQYIGKNTILLYGFNLPLLGMATYIANHVFPPALSDLIWIPSICVMAITIGLVISVPINKYLPFIVGVNKIMT